MLLGSTTECDGICSPLLPTCSPNFGEPGAARGATDESAVAKAEIEANEGSTEKSENEPGESVAAEGGSGEAGCPILMGYYNSPRCGGKLHAAPAGVDEQSVCRMHSKDPNKQSGKLFDTFWQEFERILEKAGENEAHFERFVFPHANFSKREFRAICRFEGADFTQDAHFNEATFTQNAYFGEANFKRRAIFHKATFKQNANFSSATFTQDAIFWSATFTRNAELGGATFTQKADFREATFTQKASFFEATFLQYADFSDATFTQNVCFQEATFTQKADFEKTKFHGTVDWHRCRFLDQAEFRHTKFEPKEEGTPSAVFSLAKFAKPGEVVFDDVDLSRVLFHNCDVSQVWFTSSVRWGTRKNNRGLAVFDETIPHEHEFTEGLQRRRQRDHRARDYRAVAQIYQQLKKNYDSRLDYWTANEFHFGEMEMKRLAGPARGRLFRGEWLRRHGHNIKLFRNAVLWRIQVRQQFMKLRRWWYRNLGFVAWYRRASDYGNSYRKPLLWLLGLIFILFPLLLPLPGVGLIRQGTTQAETYATNWNFQKGYGENLWAKRDLVGNSMIASVDAATFQKNPEYAPAYPWGRVLAIFETLLTSSLFALFLLAIRRQFRR